MWAVPPRAGPDGLFAFSVAFRVGDEGMEQQAFLCRAADRQHAVEQAVNAYATADILGVRLLP